MARKLPQDEEQTFGENQTSIHLNVPVGDDRQFLQLLDQKRQQPMELSPELQFGLEHVFHVKVSS
jgi:hypothetical protein